MVEVNGPEARPWRVKYDGPCSRCGRTLATGEVAVWDRSARRMHCVSCPPPDAAPVEPLPIDIGVAGASARREYQRRVAKRDANVRARFGRFAGVVLALTNEPQSTRAWAVGARGEEKLAEAVAAVPGLQVLNDRRVPGTQGNIDHIVIAPAGVFVVDAKNYEGMVRVRDRGGLFRTDLRLYVGGRDCSKLAEGMRWQVDAVAAVLATDAVESPPPLTPVLCFVDAKWPIFRAPDEYAGVRLESVKSLRRLVTAKSLLDPPTIVDVAQRLASAFPAK